MPVREFLMTCGVRLMFSAPTARTTSASSVMISFAPLTTAWKPEAHMRFTQ